MGKPCASNLRVCVTKHAVQGSAHVLHTCKEQKARQAETLPVLRTADECHHPLAFFHHSVSSWNAPVARTADGLHVDREVDRIQMTGLCYIEVGKNTLF